MGVGIYRPYSRSAIKKIADGATLKKKQGLITIRPDKKFSGVVKYLLQVNHFSLIIARVSSTLIVKDVPGGIFCQGPGRSCYFTRKSRAIAGEHENSGVRQARLGARGHIRKIFLGITKKIDGVLN